MPSVGRSCAIAVLNTDAEHYGGSGQGNPGTLATTAVEAHGHAQSLELTLPPLGALILRRAG